MDDEHPAEEEMPAGHPRYLSYRSGWPSHRRWRGWRGELPALAGFLVAGAAGGLFNYVGGTGALRGGLNPVATACSSLAIGMAPLIYYGATGRGLHDRTARGAMLPGALVGWGLAALVAGVCFASVRM